MTTAGSTPGGPAPLRYSIVVPTYQRRDVVIGSIEALAAMTGPAFEAIVVVDGSTDGTAEALRRLRVPFPLRVVEQPNAGAARARNHGVELARGQVLLFLDDDMRAAPDLLHAHEQAYADGADAVIGHVPLDPASPPGFLADGLRDWAEQRLRRLAAEGARLDLPDLLTGQLSVRREVFAALGGFDEDFTRAGTFGGEDTDFGRRLLAGGARVVFAPAAISHQHYVVTPEAYLRQWHQAGRADVTYARKHPAEVDRIFASHRPGARVNRYLWRPLVQVPVVSAVAAATARRTVLTLAARRPEAPLMRRVFFKVRDLEYWRGVQRAGGVPAPRPARVLCYHAVRDLGGVPVVEEYGVPPDQLRRQLGLLRRAGFRFVTLAEVLRCVEGSGGLPRRPVLVTFDDCFTDLLDAGVPVLTAQHVPAAAFAVAGLTGGGNEWDQAIGAPALPLLDAGGLLELERGGVEVGVHGLTHRPLPGLPDAELAEQTAGAAAELRALGLLPRAFAYPHGEHDRRSRDQVRAAGLRVAFTVAPGLVRPSAPDPYALPRIEVLRRDGAGLRLLVKVVTAGRLPVPTARDATRRLRRAAPAPLLRLARSVRAGDGGRPGDLLASLAPRVPPARDAGPPGWQRVAVVGGSATGKTDLATALAGAFRLAHVELDHLRWPGGRAATEAEFAAALASATGSPAWVVEGAEDSAPVRAVWRRAQALVWLDHSRLGVAVRMVVDTTWRRTPERSRSAYLAYLCRKSLRSGRQAARLRRELPPLLDQLRADGVTVVRLRSVQATRRWQAAVTGPTRGSGATLAAGRPASPADSSRARSSAGSAGPGPAWPA